MVQALAHGLPGGLDALGVIFGLSGEEAKDKGGRALVHLFCKPLKDGSRATRLTHPVQWEKFKAYAKRDIVSMRKLHTMMPQWNYPNGSDYALWVLDQRINERGFAVDLDLARMAIEAEEEERRYLNAATNRATDGAVEAATQRDELLQHIVKAFGVVLPDMRADTLQRRIEDESLPLPLRELLALRVQSSRNAAAKYKALLKATAIDGRLRHTLQFCGAATTGRWSGRVFQPQNLPRPTMKPAEISTAITDIKEGMVTMLYPDVPKVLGNCVRGVIVAPPRRKLIACDLSSIEGRKLAWLARDERIVEFYREVDAGTAAYDSYMLAYAMCFGVDPVTVNKTQRQIGKPIELSCFAADTRVVTSNGVKRIVDVRVHDLLWDGEQWVRHQGLVARGAKPVVSVDGIEVTPDHLIRTQATWQPAQQLASNPCMLAQALETGSESLRSLDSNLALYRSGARAELSRILSATTTYGKAQQRDATPVPKNKVATGVKTSTPSLTSYPMMHIAADYSAGSLPHVPDAKYQPLGSIRLTVDAAFASIRRGWMALKESARGCATLSKSPAGINRNLSLIAATMTEATSPAISGSCLEESTAVTSVPSEKCKNVSSSLKPVYDIAHAGPRNRFTILSDSGALVVHNCGYGGGVAAFVTFAMVYHLDLQQVAEAVWDTGDRSLLRQCKDKYAWARAKGFSAGLPELQYSAFEYVKTKWRDARPATVRFWEDLKDAFVSAVNVERETFAVGAIKMMRTGQWLRIRLPSGRQLCFLQPRADADGISYMGMNRYSRKWQRLGTHGGKLSGIITQASSSDILRAALPELESRGYKTVLTVHDEAICETPDTDAYTAAGMVQVMTAPLPWAPGLPLSADGFETYRYRKAD